jgi:hypothetical protein
MSRISNLVAIGVVVVVAIFGRRLAAQILGPGTLLYQMGASGEFGSPAIAKAMFEAFAVWVPWLAIIGVITAAAYREFRRQRVSQQRRVR